MCSRKLVRSVSTCCEDISLDEALNELSHLNQRHALREQWARKNMKTAKYRPSGSVCSTASSSSVSTSSSSTSSFSSSMSATLSSSESWDSFSDSSDISMSISSSVDYPRVVRRLSKPKLNMYRPYSKPRRFSLQLVSHPESPETLDDLSHNSVISSNSGKQSSCSTMSSCIRSQTPPKYSRLVSEKENFSTGSGSGVKVKSNPTSPSKSDLSSVLLDTNLMQFNAINDRLLSSTTTNTCSPLLGTQHLTTTGMLLRSKSLDDLSLCSAANNAYINDLNELNSSSILFPKQSPAMAAAQSCDIDHVLQRISTLQV